MKRHELKTHPVYFEAVLSKNKTFELRENDRNFELNDLVILREYDPILHTYTGREFKFKISYILNLNKWFLDFQYDYVILGIGET